MADNTLSIRSAAIEYRVHGVDALYTPADTPTAPELVRVIIDEDISSYLFAGVDVSDDALLISIRNSEIYNMRSGDTVIVGTEYGDDRMYRIIRRASTDGVETRYFARAVM